MGKVFHSCGHEDTYRPSAGWPLIFKDGSCDVGYGVLKCVNYATYCKDCYISFINLYPEDVFMSNYEANEWLDTIEPRMV